MIAKVVAILAFAAAASAGAIYDTHVGAQSEQTVRGLGFGGLSTVSHQTKAVDSAFSSVRKHDTRVINPAVYAAAAPVATYQHAAPVAAYHAAPVAHYQHAAPVATYQHAAPVAAYHAAPVAHYQHAAPVATYHHAAPVAYAPAVAKVAAPVAYAQAPVAYAPAVAKVAAPVAYAAAPVTKVVSGLGVSYSAVPQVAHLTFDGFGVHYGY